MCERERRREECVNVSVCARFYNKHEPQSNAPLCVFTVLDKEVLEEAEAP